MLGDGTLSRDWTFDSSVVPPTGDVTHWRERHGGLHLEWRYLVNTYPMNTFDVNKFIIVFWIIVCFTM
jgi:hypothetical protein